MWGFTRRPAALERPFANHLTFKTQHRLGYSPSIIDVANHICSGDSKIVEKLLIELRLAGDLNNWPNFETFRRDRHNEHREPAMLWHVRICAGEAHRVVGKVGSSRPDLRTIQDE